MFNFVAAWADWLGFQMLHINRVGQPSHQRKAPFVRCSSILWREQSISTCMMPKLACNLSLASKCRRFETPLQRRGLACSWSFITSAKIPPGAQVYFRSQKPRCPLTILMFEFLAGPAKLHPKPFSGFQLHHGCLSDKFKKRRVLCVSLVVLLSSGKYSHEYNLQKFLGDWHDSWAATI